ncbi:hypothetical protein FRC20_005523 [Serendipita sp. 405]|nr:hypothetical protein FRC20_005523 [Serendipita sp. 405]
MQKRKVGEDSKPSSTPSDRLLSRDEHCLQAEAAMPNPISHKTVYDVKIHPTFDSNSFEAAGDFALSQLPIYDVDDSIVQPWKVLYVLVEGAIVACRVILVEWIINDRAV